MGEIGSFYAIDHLIAWKQDVISIVDISPEIQSVVDGGVRNVSPIGDVLDEEPDEIVIINFRLGASCVITSRTSSSLRRP